MTLIFDIKRFALNDGPGIRTTLFLKGCPLRCVWCHNPEGQRPEAQRLYTPNKCIGCGTCVSVCPQKAISPIPRPLPNPLLMEKPWSPLLQEETREATRKACILCGTCADACPTTALKMSGHAWPMEELMAV
ncbi:MAG: 4Fe-4S binding protein, partial [Bacteroidaceae bacterium]|nr:4Fe-4S binding protein [Bacteroidaceae bacterium]